MKKRIYILLLLTTPLSILLDAQENAGLTLPNGFKFPILIEFSKSERKKDDEDRYNMFNMITKN